MFNRKRFLDNDFNKKLVEDLKKRRYPIDFINIVLNLEKDIRLSAQLTGQQQILQQEKNKLTPQGLKTKNEVLLINNNLKDLEEKIEVLEKKINEVLPNIPNVLHPNVPEGNDSHHNIEMYKNGNPVKKNLAHYDMNFIDYPRELTGARFVLLKGKIATLERAIGNFLINFLVQKRGFEEVSVPLMLTEDALRKSGHIPKERDNMFYIQEKNSYLIPTSECVLVNLLQNQTISIESLPKKYTAFSSNFRKEAGSYGKDTKGLIRLHQFQKVEMVAFTKNEEESMMMFQEFVKNATGVLDLLGLPYRVISICSGDLGFNATCSYDVEVWMAGTGEYREISSISYCGTFQSENLRSFSIDKDKKKNLLHTLNGTSVAVGRLLAALMEYYYDNGKIYIPEILQPYTNFSIID